jgi:hypothetical protein
MSQQQTAPISQQKTMELPKNELIPQLQPMELLQQEPAPEQQPEELQNEPTVPQQPPVELPQEALAPNDIPVVERVASSEDMAIYLEWYGNKCCPLCNTGTPTVPRADPRYKSYTTLHTHLFEKHTAEQRELLNDLVPNSNSDEFKTFVHDFLGLKGLVAEKYKLWSMERETRIAAGSSF